ncbi:MAG: hypothetical protein GXY23_16610 [Myxococcales bacterium]|jgi:hypothetical protein|nr:hypothetical protein [Myxococcales bacterium]
MTRTTTHRATALRARGLLTLLSIAGLVLASACGGSSTQHGSTTPEQASSGSEFDSIAARVRQGVSEWDEGSAIVLAFYKEATGEEIHVVFADPTAPLYREDLGFWVIQGIALDESDDVLGHLLLGLRDLRPGEYYGSDQSNEAFLAVLFTEGDWDGQDPDACWSVNPQSFVRFTLREGGAGLLRGDIQGKLTANDDSGYLSVSNGVIFIRR